MASGWPGKGHETLCRENHHPPVEALTPRETEVLTLLTTGQTNQQIAEFLNISKGTAKIHRSNISSASWRSPTVPRQQYAPSNSACQHAKAS